MTDKIAETFGIAPMDKGKAITINNDVGLPAPIITNEDIAKDYSDARRTLLNVIDVGTAAAQDLQVLAGATDSVGHYMALSSMLKALTSAAVNLKGLHESKDGPKKEPPLQQHNTQVNTENAVFIGTPAEMLAMIKKEKENARLSEQSKPSQG